MKKFLVIVLSVFLFVLPCSAVSVDSTETGLTWNETRYYQPENLVGKNITTPSFYCYYTFEITNTNNSQSIYNYFNNVVQPKSGDDVSRYVTIGDGKFYDSIIFNDYNNITRLLSIAYPFTEEGDPSYTAMYNGSSGFFSVELTVGFKVQNNTMLLNQWSMENQAPLEKGSPAINPNFHFLNYITLPDSGLSSGGCIVIPKSIKMELLLSPTYYPTQLAETILDVYYYDGGLQDLLTVPVPSGFSTESTSNFYTDIFNIGSNYTTEYLTFGFAIPSYIFNNNYTLEKSQFTYDGVTIDFNARFRQESTDSLYQAGFLVDFNRDPSQFRHYLSYYTISPWIAYKINETTNLNVNPSGSIEGELDISGLYQPISIEYKEGDNLFQDIGTFFTQLFTKVLPNIFNNFIVWFMCESPLISNLTKPVYLTARMTGDYLAQYVVPLVSALGLFGGLVGFMILTKFIVGLLRRS